MKQCRRSFFAPTALNRLPQNCDQVTLFPFAELRHSIVRKCRQHLRSFALVNPTNPELLISIHVSSPHPTPTSPAPHYQIPSHLGTQSRNRDPRTRENLPMSTRFLSTVNCKIAEHRRPPIGEAGVVKLTQNRPLCQLRVFFGPFFARVLPKTACSCDRVFTGHFPCKHSLTRSTAARPCRRPGRRSSGPWPCRRHGPQ